MAQIPFVETRYKALSSPSHTPPCSTPPFHTPPSLPLSVSYTHIHMHTHQIPQTHGFSKLGFFEKLMGKNDCSLPPLQISTHITCPSDSSDPNSTSQMMALHSKNSQHQDKLHCSTLPSAHYIWHTAILM